MEVYEYYIAARLEEKQDGAVAKKACKLDVSSNFAIFRVSKVISTEARRQFYSRIEFPSTDCESMMDHSSLLALVDLTILLVEDHYKFLHSIGKENRLFMQNMVLLFEAQLDPDGFFRLSSDVFEVSTYEYYLSGIFRMLSGAHNIQHLVLRFSDGSLDLFLQMEKVVQAFETLRDIKTVKIEYLREDTNTQEGVGCSVDMLDIPELAPTARKLIASAQRQSESPPESKVPDPPFVDRAKSLNNKLTLLLNDRASFVRQREALAKEIGDCKAETVRAERRFLNLEQSISEIEGDIEKLVPTIISEPLSIT